MEYMTVREAAEKWKISGRLVQKYCSEGRIDGADKFGRSWRIPENAIKPGPIRRKKESSMSKREQEKQILFSDLMPLMNTAFEPGSCKTYIKNMEDGPRKEIALTEYYYFSGKSEKAVKKAELFLDSQELDLKLSACFICAYANLTIGQIHRARHSLVEMKNTLASVNKDMPAIYHAGEAFVAFAAVVLLHLPMPEEIPPIQEFLAILPPGLQIFALYVQAHYIYLKGEYEKSIGIIETAFAIQQKIYPIPTIYLHMAAVMDYMSLKQPEKARKHLLEAWELARKDDLIEAFGEHHGLLGGMLEAVIKPNWPKDFKRIIDITYRFAEGWRKVHNPITGHEVADNLTTTEFTTAMLSARGWTNQEIANHMNISVNTVKQYISTALQKLHIEHRKDLKKYMLQ